MDIETLARARRAVDAGVIEEPVSVMEANARCLASLDLAATTWEKVRAELRGLRAELFCQRGSPFEFFAEAMSMKWPPMPREGIVHTWTTMPSDARDRWTKAWAEKWRSMQE